MKDNEINSKNHDLIDSFALYSYHCTCQQAAWATA